MPARNPIRRSASLLLFFIFLALGAQVARAEHFSGASITYQCNGGNMYTVVLELYLDCIGTPITPQSLHFTNSCGVVFSLNNMTPTLVEEVSPLCQGSMLNSTCNGGNLPGFRRYRFESTLFLAPCNFWTISWSICCRNDMVNVQGLPGTYVEATLNNAGGVCDNSPVFADGGIPYVCLGNDLLYSPGATDPDGNTMVFSLISARQNLPPPAPVNYEAGFSGPAPLPGMTIDPNTGQLNFAPAVMGNYVVVIQVATYDANGALIGTVMRDLMFVAVTCDGTPPDTEGLSNAQNALISDSYTIEVCDGVNFCVDIAFVDTDPGNVISIISDAGDLLPGSTFQVNGLGTTTATLCWTPDASLLPITIFVQADDGQCPIMNITSTSFLIEEADPPATLPNAGTDGTTTGCSTGPPMVLFPFLGGAPDAGGSWSAPDGTAHSGNFQPGVDPFGDYTYQVGPGCYFATAVVTVIDGGGGDAGTDGDLTICSVGDPVDLFNSLGGTPTAGGNWTGPNGAMDGMYDPAVHGPGAYTYTLVGGACPGATATVIVAEVPAANAGTDANVALCSTSPPSNLLAALGAGAQAGGTWTGPSAINGIYDPAQHTPGDYTYTVIGDAPCGAATATVTVNENIAPHTGNNANLTICGNSAPVDLFTILNGTPQPGGAWAGPAGAMDGIYDPAIHDAGNYSYTIQGIAPCANSTSFVIVTEVAAPDAGEDASVELCTDDAPVDLFTLLGGTPGANGIWSGPSAMTGVFDPAQHLPGDYFYTVTGSPVCGNAVATVSVIVNATVDAGEDSAITICSDDAPLDLFGLLGGTPQPGGIWAGPTATAGTYTPGVHLPGTYTYSFAGGGPCGTSSATVTITEVAAADAGTMGAIALCSSDAPVDLFGVLGGTPQPGGTWDGPSPIMGLFDPAVHAGGVYIYTVTAAAPCADASASVNLTLAQAADAGDDGVVDICVPDGPVDLFAALGASAQPGGTWAGPSPITGMFAPTLHDAGSYTYTVEGNGACINATATIMVSASMPPDAGNDAALELCSNSAPVDLFALLIGTPQPGGTWSGPDVITGIFDPAIHDEGIYTYTVAGNAACPDASATVDVNIVGAPDAGTDGTVAVCSDQAPVDLFLSLGGTPQPGGTWVGPSAITGIYDPAVHDAGAYMYSIVGLGNCLGSSAIVTVVESMPANAGTDGVVDLCSNAAVVDLFNALGGTPQGGGTWSGPSPLNAGLFDASTHAPGVYTYTIVPGDPCPIATASVTVNVDQVTNAGTDGSITICDVGAPQDLFALLGGSPDPGGVWSGPSAITGMYDPQLHDPGVYTYTVEGSGTCPSSSATVTVVETGTPNAGVDTVVSVCSNDAPLDLFQQLTGADSGGVWSGPVAGFTGSFDPDVHPEGIYTYSINAIAPCVSDQAQVTVLINPAPNAGSNGSIIVCENGGAMNLFSVLGGTPQAGGTWVSPSGAPFNGMYDPAVDEPGDYAYIIMGSAPCGSASAVVSVTQTSNPNAGTDASVTLCSNDPPIELFSLLGGAPDQGGTWSGPSNGMNGTFDPALHLAGVYTYTLIAPPPCVSDASTVTVTIIEGADAGDDAAITLCASGAAVDLFTLLGGSPQTGGTWTGPSPLANGLFDPAQDAPGTYIYTVTTTGNCGSAMAEVVVAVTGNPNAGEDAAISLCSDAPAFSLFAVLGGTPDPGGTWSGPSTVVNGMFDPAAHLSGVYTYTLTPTPPCVGDQASVIVSVEQVGNAGTSTSLDICPGAAPVDLLAQLGSGAQGGGTWSGPDPDVSGTFDPAVHTGGVYVYTLSGIECPDASASITITLLEGANAGGSASIQVCSTDAPFELIDQLAGDPDANGVWTNAAGEVVSATLFPASAISGAYTYTVPGTGSCPAAQATLQVQVSAAPQAGISGMLELCADQGQHSLFDGLSGTLDAGGSWTDPNGLPHATVIDPLIDIAGTYTYTVTSAGCPQATSTVNLIIHAAPDAGGNATVAFCSSDGGASLMSLLNGTPDTGGSWLGPDGLPPPAMFIPGTSLPGEYTYTVNGNDACGMDQATVTIVVSNAVSAGTSGSVTICANDDAFNLFAHLGGTPDAGGIWITPAGTQFNGVLTPANDLGGSFTYIVEADAPCAMASAVVMVDMLPVPAPHISVSSNGGCAPTEVTFSHDFVGAASCVWIFGNGSFVQDCGPVTTTFEEAGSYDITLIIDGGNDCGSNTILYPGGVNIFNKPVAEFEALPEIIGTRIPDAYFHNYSQGATNYLWDMGGTGTYTDVHVNHTFPAQLGDEYNVCLIAYASPYCADTICKTITVSDALNIFIPNAFSPDDDGVNDVFRPILNGIDPQRYQFSIFDRWGSPVFSTNDPHAGWDGRFATGQETPQGVYVWKVELKDSYSGGRVEQMGHVTLIR